MTRTKTTIMMKMMMMGDGDGDGSRNDFGPNEKEKFVNDRALQPPASKWARNKPNVWSRLLCIGH